MMNSQAFSKMRAIAVLVAMIVLVAYVMVCLFWAMILVLNEPWIFGGLLGVAITLMITAYRYLHFGLLEVQKVFSK